MFCCCTEDPKDDIVIAEPKSAFGMSKEHAIEPSKVVEAAPPKEFVKEEPPVVVPVPPMEPPKTSDASGRSDLKSWQFIATISKTPDGAKIGLDTVARQTHHEGPCLKIKKLKEEGLITIYNESQTDESKRVCIGDFILEVNGVRGSTDELYKVIGSSDVLSMLISRPPSKTVPVE
mmetsp:Transcript_35513/g.75729  ORF Transcript_35513/g.75729 Transcript_35513/m.75729 type:complete len:176 (-) Transcript_35513:204-731(-)|eukprot:CAMPEP_0206487030 /NCGR_PEP_ID=MMETSP0324_2-20121206/41370_1 /ASSEMBLY_ACC=CAM_ASM_000836 /TAXON_ID=2866 /ORGANISM="Crypthecodinium cohnii, Strain Seligo" /LENGTH=175 /DNA_ID=CAMNT_0053965377 /DNA_START=107 /DNA_END=634 /DNA_ORIENTATION=-